MIQRIGWKKKKILFVLPITILIIYVVLSMLPFAWILLNSFRIHIDITSSTFFISRLTLENYTAALVRTNVWKFMVDSLIIGGSSAFIAVLAGSLAAYGMARFNVGGKYFPLVFIGVRLLPIIAIALPLYILFRQFNLLDTYVSLFSVYFAFGLTFAVPLMHNFIRDIPKEIDESAMMDGCSSWKIFWKIILPLASPGLIACWILCFIGAWNEFLFALLLVGIKVKTAPLGLAEYSTQYGIMWGEMSAATCLAVIPVLIFAIIVQRRLVAGLTMGMFK